MAGLGDIDTNGVTPGTGGRDFVPAMNRVKAIIVDSERKQNSKGTGDILSLNWQLIEGQYSGAILNQTINIRHQDDKTQMIAKGELEAIRQATGKPSHPGQDSAEFHGIPCDIKVGVQPARGDFAERSIVKRVYTDGGGQRTQTQPAQTMAAPPPQQGQYHQPAQGQPAQAYQQPQGQPQQPPAAGGAKPWQT